MPAVWNRAILVSVYAAKWGSVHMDMGGGQAGAKRVESGKRSGMGAVRRAFKSLFNVREGRASYETIRKRFVNGSRLDGMHLCILIIAMLIASIGLNTDSTECIVGAMLICPLMGSVLAISYSVATVDRHLMRDAPPRACHPGRHLPYHIHALLPDLAPLDRDERASRKLQPHHMERARRPCGRLCRWLR